MIGPDLCGGQFSYRQFLGTIMKQNYLETVTGILGTDQMSERERYFFRRRETVFAVQDHRVRTVEQDDRRARRAVILLMNVQVLVLEIDRDREPFAGDRRQQRRV